MVGGDLRFSLPFPTLFRKVDRPLASMGEASLDPLLRSMLESEPGLARA